MLSAAPPWRGRPVRRCAGLVLALCFVFSAVAPVGLAGLRSASPKLTILAFSGSPPRNARTIPPDAVKPGGTYGSCRLADLQALYASVSYAGMRNGPEAEVRWLVAGRLAYSFRFRWDSGATGRDVYFVDHTAKRRRLEDGRWQIVVLYGGSVLASASVTRVTDYC